MKHFGIKFEEVQIALYQPESSAQIRQYSPSGKVHALKHDDLVIWESLAILEYLSEQHPQHQFWPVDRPARAVARSLSSEMHAGFLALRTEMPMNCRARIPDHPMSPALAIDIRRIEEPHLLQIHTN